MDLVDCDDITDVGILKELNKRYQTRDVYSAIGPIIIAVNPYAAIPNLYEPALLTRFSTVDDFMSDAPQYGRATKPHVWMVPSTAYQQLRLQRHQQAIVISGESGAGKTETTKLCLQLLSHIASESHKAEGGSVGRIEDKVLATNPVLESFGNAKTARNNNSSRFGKWLEIVYTMDSKENGKPILSGAKITPYLLEKSRVVHHASDERNYHIFYQACANGILDLQPAASYKYLRFSKSMNIPGVDDKQDFEETCKSMGSLGFSDRDQETVFEVIKSILLLGNLTFVETKDSGEGNAVTVSRDDDTLLRQVAGLLGVQERQLSGALVSRSMTLRGETMFVQFSVSQAQDAANALAKEMYGRLFAFIVNQANSTLYSEASNGDNAIGSQSSIGLLDIFGFEKFKTNSFEQLCINYANEKLQQYFINYVLKKEQDLYLAESVTFDMIAPIDNVDVLQLFESKKDGIFRRLDDELKLGQNATDATFLSRIVSIHNSKDPQRRFFQDTKMGTTQFEIRHFAGVIRYDVRGFMEKNRDKLSDDLEELLRASTRQRFREIMTVEYKSPAERQAAEEAASSAAAAPSSTATFATISSRFQNQLQQLVDVLQASQPHFIKCIKPNNSKQAFLFEDETVLTQLRYSGVLEAIQVRKSGFPIRRSHESFWKSYWCLWPGMKRKKLATIPEDVRCRELLPNLTMLKGDVVRLGRTLAFCKSDAITALETAKAALRDKSVVKLQSTVRRHQAMQRADHLRQVRDNLMSIYEYGLQHNRSNIGVIGSLKAALDVAVAARLSTLYTGKVEVLLQRLYQVKSCLDKLDRFINKDVAVDVDLPILDEYKELSELASMATELQIQSPILVSVKDRLALIKERAEAVVALTAAADVGDEDDIRAAIERIRRLERAHQNEVFCPNELARAQVVLQGVAEDYSRMQALLTLAESWRSFLDKKISKAADASKKKNANLIASLTEQIKNFNDSLLQKVNEFNARPILSKAVRHVVETTLKFEQLHRQWLDKDWTATFLAVQWILDQCQSDFVSFVTDSRKRQVLASNWNVLQTLMHAELTLIAQDLVENFIIPKFVARVQAGGLLGSAVGSIDVANVDYEQLANDINEVKGYTFLQAAIDPILLLVEPHLEVRGLFIDARWEKIIASAESDAQRDRRRVQLLQWMEQLQDKDRYDESFLGDLEYFATRSGGDDDDAGGEDADGASPATEPTDEKLLELKRLLDEEKQLMLREAADRFMHKLFRYVLQAETRQADELTLADGRVDFPNVESVLALVQQLASIYGADRELPSARTERIVDGAKQLLTLRRSILGGQLQSIYTADQVVSQFLTETPYDSDDVFYQLKEQLATAYAYGCAAYIEAKLMVHLTQHPVVFPLSPEKKKDGLYAIDQALLFVQDCEKKTQFLDSLGRLETSTQRLMQLVKVLCNARRQFFANKRSQMKPFLKDVQEMCEECASMAWMATADGTLQDERQAMELTVQYTEKMVALEQSLAASQPIRYFVPFVESASSDAAMGGGNGSNTPHSRLKSMSSEFDLLSSVTSLAVKDILKEENLMINDAEIEFRDLLSVLNMAKEFQEELESNGTDLPDDIVALMEAADLVVAVRKNIVTTDFVVAMKHVQTLLSKGFHRKIDVVGQEIDHNLHELSNSAMVVVCMTALAHGRPTGPIGLFDYKTILTNTLEETIEMAQCFELESPRVKALFDAVLIVTDLRKAQKMGDWKGVADILEKAHAQKIGRGYSDVCFEEISRASVEKDNFECIQALRMAIVNEELGCKDGFIDRDGVVTKELVAALSKSASLPEDTRGPILKGIFQLGEAVLKMRKAAKDSEDYLNELVSIVSDAFDNFRNDLDGMGRPGSMQRKASSVRTMRNTLAPRSKVSFLDTSANAGASILGLKSPTQSMRKTSQDEFTDLVAAIKRELELIKHHYDLQELEGEIRTALEGDGVELDEEGNIHRANINLDKLREVMLKADELNASRLSLSKQLKELKEIGDVIYEIRHAVYHDQWESMSATLENTVGGEQGLHWPEYTRREISIARSEVENRWIITNVTAALQKDRLYGELGEVPLVEVSNRDLLGYITTAKTLKPRTDEAVRLIAAAERMCTLRGLITIREINPEKFTAAVNAIDWQHVKRMAKDILLDVQQKKCHAIVGPEARLIAEFAEDRMICLAMEQALLTGGVRGRPGRLDLSALSTKELDRAYQQAMRSPIKTENAKILVSVCRVMLKLRETIRRAETTAQFEDAVDAWAAIKQLLQEVSAQQKEVRSELNCWELCDEEVDLIQRHSVVQDMKTSLIESSIEASHIYHERHTYVPQEDIATLDLGTAELKLLNDELERMVSTSREVSFQSDNLSEYVACATSLRMYRSLVVDRQWPELERLMQEKTLRNHLNLIKQVKAEYAWITCELHNNMAIDLLRRALLREEPAAAAASDGSADSHSDRLRKGATASSTDVNSSGGGGGGGAVGDDAGWDLDLLKAGSYSDRNAQLYAVMEEARKFKITSNVAKAWLEICENMYQLRTSLERRDNVVVARCLRWFKSNGRICPQVLKVEAQRAYELHQNDLLLNGLRQALAEGKPSGRRGEMDISTIETAAIESLLAQAEGIHPKIADVTQLLGAATTVLHVRQSLLQGDMARLQSLMDELSYEEHIPLEIIEEVAVARAELDNRLAIASLVEALSSFEDTDAKKVDFTFLSASSGGAAGGGSVLDAAASPLPFPDAGAAAATSGGSANGGGVSASGGGGTGSASPSPSKGDFETRRKSMGLSILESFSSRRYSFANRSSSNIDPETIDTDTLDKGMRLAKLHGIFSEKAARLFRTVDLVRSLRLAMKQFDWAEVEAIMEDAKFEENVGTRYDELASREIQAIRSQLDVRAAIVDLSKALKVGWAKCSHGLVDTSDMRNDVLEDAIERAERSIHDLNIADTPALKAGIRSGGSGGNGGGNGGGGGGGGGKKRVTFRDEVEEQDQKLKHQQSVSDQLTLLMRSARKVLQIRELLAVGNMEDAGSMAEDALTSDTLHYTVVEELRLYAKEINTALVSMRLAENLRLIALKGKLAPLQAAIQDALSSDIHQGTDLGIICTLTRAQRFFAQLLALRERLQEMQHENDLQRVEAALNWAAAVRYGDDEIHHVRQRLLALRQFEDKCDLVDELWAFLSDERSLFRRLLQYAYDWKVASHPYSVRLSLCLKLSATSLRTVKCMHAVRRRCVYALMTQTMRVKHQYLALPSSVQRFRLELFPQLRRPEDFALRMTIVSEELKRGMLTYSDQPLPTSLTKLPPSWASLATFVFTCCIRGLEKNFFSHVDVMLLQLVNLGRRCLLLRDELYLQLIKQMRQNPDAQGVARLWRICLACLYHFPCSAAFENYFEAYLRLIAETEFRQYRYARQAIRYLHRALFCFGYDRTLPAIDKDQRAELRRWLVDAHFDPFQPETLKAHGQLPPASSTSMTTSSSTAAASVTSPAPTLTHAASSPALSLSLSDPSTSGAPHAKSAGNLSLLSLEELISEDLHCDAVFPHTPAAPVAPPTPVQTITGLLGLQIPAQNAALGIHSTAARLVGQTVSQTAADVAAQEAAAAAATAAATASAAAAAAAIHIRGVRENWIHRFRAFNASGGVGGSAMTRQTFAAALAATMGGAASAAGGMDGTDRDVFYFLLLGKKMPHRAAILREFLEDRHLFHFSSEEEAANSALRRQWLERHVPVSEFSSELFFSQMQSSDFVVYAERFWDRVILKMSRDCLHFPFLQNWERDPAAAAAAAAVAAAGAAPSIDSAATGAAPAAPASTSSSSPTPPGGRRRTGSSASSSASPGATNVRRSLLSKGGGSASRASLSAAADVSISWELYREIVLTGMKKYLQQFAPPTTTPSSATSHAGGTAKVSAAKTLLRVAVKKLGAASALSRRKSLSAMAAAGGDDDAAAALQSHDSAHSLSAQHMVAAQHNRRRAAAAKAKRSVAQASSSSLLTSPAALSSSLAPRDEDEDEDDDEEESVRSVTAEY